MNELTDNDPRIVAIPDVHGHAKGEHKPYAEERPIPLSARMLFLWFYHACRRGYPKFMMVTDHMNYLTFEDPAAINLVRRALKLADAGDLLGAAETAGVDVEQAQIVSRGLRSGMRFSIGAEVDNDPRSRPDAQNIVDAMKPDAMIRSVHFLQIDHPTHGPNWSWPFDNPEFRDVFDLVGTERTWELYMATLLDAIERLPGHIVGHFYVPAVFGHWPDDATLERYEDQLVAACETRGLAIEINTRFLYRDHPSEEQAKYLAAHRRLLGKCKAKNVPIAVGSDAHSPKDQGRGFEAVLALLDECEINELIFPIAGRLARVALRVERKPEPPAPVAPLLKPPADERKSVRKARGSEAPARPPQTSPKRDDSADDAAAGADAPAVHARPKRGKARPAATAPDTPSTPAAAPAADEPQAFDAGDAERATDAASADNGPSPSNGAEAATPDEHVTDAAASADGDPFGPDGPIDTDTDEIGTAAASPAAAGDESGPGELQPGQTVSEAIEASDPDVPALVPDPTASAPPGPRTVRRPAPAAGRTRRSEPEPRATSTRTASAAKGKPAAKRTAAAKPGAKAKPAARAAKAAPPKAAAKHAPAKKKATAKKSAAKAAPKKAAPKKAAAKKPAARKAVAKKAPVKKTAAKKAPVRAAAAKKAVAKRGAVKKAAPKKAAPKRR